MTADRQKALSRLADLSGVLLGIQILAKGVDKLPYFSHFPLHVGFLLLAGGFVVVGSFLHHFLEKWVKNVHALFHLLEGAVLIVTALLLYEKGHVSLPLVLLLLGVVYAVVGLVSFRMNEQNRLRLGRSLLRWIGLAFLVAGTAMLVLNRQHGDDPWVYGAGGLFLVLGACYFFFNGWIMAKFPKPDHGLPSPPAAEPEDLPESLSPSS